MKQDGLNLEINYSELLKELIEGIPQFSESWTDHNPSDFGIMILELYSFIADNYLYRVNQTEPDILKYFFESFPEKFEIDNADLVGTSSFEYQDFLSQRENISNSDVFRKALNICRIIFNNSLVAVTQEDVERLAERIVPRLSRSGENLFLRGIDVKHLMRGYRFVITPLIEDLNEQASGVRLKRVGEQLVEFVNQRKLLGSKVKYKAPKIIKLKDVYLRVSFNTSSSEWNRNTGEIISEKLDSYFNLIEEEAGLSLKRSISLFDVYNTFEELENINYVENIRLSFNDGTLLTDQPSAEEKYEVLLEFEGEISVAEANINIDRIVQ